MDEDLRNLAKRFQSDVIDIFMDEVRHKNASCSFKTLYLIISLTDKASEYQYLIKQMELFFKDWLPLFNKYPNISTLLVSEKFYWESYAIDLSGKVVNPLSNIFLLMCGFDSIAIYSTEAVMITHVTSDNNLQDIRSSGYLKCSKSNEDASYGLAIYAYAESTGLVATAYGERLIRVDCHKPWARIVSYEDNTIKPIGEVLILEDLSVKNAEFYDTQDYLQHKEIKFYNRNLMLRFFGIKATEEQVNDYIFTNQLSDERYRFSLPTDNNSLSFESGNWIRPVLKKLYRVTDIVDTTMKIQAF